MVGGSSPRRGRRPAVLPPRWRPSAATARTTFTNRRMNHLLVSAGAVPRSHLRGVPCPCHRGPDRPRRSLAGDGRRPGAFVGRTAELARLLRAAGPRSGPRSWCRARSASARRRLVEVLADEVRGPTGSSRSAGPGPTGTAHRCGRGEVLDGVGGRPRRARRHGGRAGGPLRAGRGRPRRSGAGAGAGGRGRRRRRRRDAPPDPARRPGRGRMDRRRSSSPGARGRPGRSGATTC